MKAEHTAIALKDMEIITGFLSVEECAKKLGVSGRRVRQYIEEGRLPAAKIGRQYFISKEALAVFRRKPRKIGRPRKVG